MSSDMDTSSTSSSLTDDSACNELRSLRLKSSSSQLGLQNLFENVEDKDAKFNKDAYGIDAREIRFDPFVGDFIKFKGLSPSTSPNKIKKVRFTDRSPIKLKFNQRKKREVNENEDQDIIDEPLSSITQQSSSLFSNKNNSISNSTNSGSGTLDPTLTLVRGLNKLTLNGEDPESAKSFSLRLNDQDIESQRNNTPELSYDQVDDILDQTPPSLPKNPSIPLFDSLKLENNHLKDIINKLSESLNINENTENYSNNELILKINELIKICFEKIDKSKVQIIKFEKQLNDNQLKLLDNLNIESKLKNEIESIKFKFENLMKEKNYIELEYKSISNKLLNEENENGLLESNLKKQLKNVYDLEIQLESTISKIQEIEKLVKSQISNNKELGLVEGLTELIEVSKELKINNSKLIEENNQQFSLNKNLNNSINFKDEEIFKLKENLTLITKNSIELEDQLRILINNNKELNLNLQNKNELFEILSNKSKEIEIKNEDLKKKLNEYNDYKNEITNEKSELISKLNTCELKLSDEVKFKNELKSKNDEQLNEIKFLKNQLLLSNEERNQIKAFNDTLSYELKLTTSKFNNKCEEFESYRQHCEILTKSRNNSLKQKDDEIKSLKLQIDEQIESSNQMKKDVSDYRLKLSDKINENNVNLKKIESINKRYETLQEINKSLRSDILQNSHIKQELKRSIVDLCVGIIKEFEGIIDESSVSNVKESLNLEKFLTLTDGKHVEKLNDICNFIQEGVVLIIQEYWSLNKRIIDCQRQNLASSSINSIQRLNVNQSNKLIKLERKVHQYEQIFRQIYSVNERPNTTSVRRRMSSRHISNEFIEDDDGLSINSNDKQNEINKLISKVTSKNLDY